MIPAVPSQTCLWTWNFSAHDDIHAPDFKTYRKHPLVVLGDVDTNGNKRSYIHSTASPWMLR